MNRNQGNQRRSRSPSRSRDAECDDEIQDIVRVWEVPANRVDALTAMFRPRRRNEQQASQAQPVQQQNAMAAEEPRGRSQSRSNNRSQSRMGGRTQSRGGRSQNRGSNNRNQGRDPSQAPRAASQAPRAASQAPRGPSRAPRGPSRAPRGPSRAPSQTPSQAPSREPSQAPSRAPSERQSMAPAPESICGNCLQRGHEVLRCIGPVDYCGLVAGCGFCNARHHYTEQCSNFDPGNQESVSALARMMLFDRRNLPILVCSNAPNEWPEAQPGGCWEHVRPWTADKAVQSTIQDPFWWEKVSVTQHRKDQVDLGADPLWNTPELIQKPTKYAIPRVKYKGHRTIRWGSNKRKRDPDEEQESVKAESIKPEGRLSSAENLWNIPAYKEN